MDPPILVFVQNKERAKELYNEVKFDDIRADVIHADLSQIQVILCDLLSRYTVFRMCSQLMRVNELLTTKVTIVEMLFTLIVFREKMLLITSELGKHGF